MKKIISSLILALIVVFMFSSLVHAGDLTKNDIADLVAQTNNDISGDIINSQHQAALINSKYHADLSVLQNALSQSVANSNECSDALNKINDLYNSYQNDMNNLINSLITNTNDKARTTIQIGNDNGVRVICQLEPYRIGNSLVWIDPLRVLGEGKQ